MPETTRNARTAILDRIRAANQAVDAEMCRAEYQTIAREYRQAPHVERAEILNMLAERLRDYGAQVHEATQATVRPAISEMARQEAVVAQGFPQQWLPEGLRWQWEVNADLESLDNTAIAIVTCEVAIAHTGTIVLNGLRKLSLLPDRLLCIVREDQIVETVSEAVARLQPFAAAALTFISGPSATADIEMNRIQGVHGPRFLEVLVVKE
jgi:L-lactate dehydrogenase complex protein LldG